MMSKYVSASCAIISIGVLGALGCDLAGVDGTYFWLTFMVGLLMLFAPMIIGGIVEVSGKKKNDNQEDRQK